MKSVLVVGLDGVTWKVLKPLLKKNRLPFLRSLIEKSAYGVLESTIPPLSAPAWVTFQTGVNPGKHGIFEFLNYRTADGSPQINTARDIRSKTLWEILAEYKLKSLVINMPLSYPVRKMNGIILSSFLTPVGVTYAYPKSVEKELAEIDYEIDILVDKKYGLMPDKTLDATDNKYYLKRLLEISEKRLQAYKLLSKKDNFSFQFILFKECDVAQHLFWGLPELDKFYTSLDPILQKLYEDYQTQAGEKSLIVMSDHGFHRAANTQFSPYVMLNEIAGSEDVRFSKNFWKISAKFNKKLKKFGITATEIRVVKYLRNSLLDKGRKEKSKANRMVPTFFGIYFNEINIEEKKVIIKKVLNKLRELNKQHKIFDLIFTPDKLYRGPNINNLPDIVWKVNERFTINTSPFAERLIDKRVSRLRGDHEADPEGIFIASSQQFISGRSKRERIENIPHLVLKLLNVPIPWFFDGKRPKFYLDKIDSKLRKKVHARITKEVDQLR